MPRRIFCYRPPLVNRSLVSLLLFATAVLAGSGTATAAGGAAPHWKSWHLLPEQATRLVPRGARHGGRLPDGRPQRAEGRAVVESAACGRHQHRPRKPPLAGASGGSRLRLAPLARPLETSHRDPGGPVETWRANGSRRDRRQKGRVGNDTGINPSLPTRATIVNHFPRRSDRQPFGQWDTRLYSGRRRATERRPPPPPAVPFPVPSLDRRFDRDTGQESSPTLIRRSNEGRRGLATSCRHRLQPRRGLRVPAPEPVSGDSAPHGCVA